MQQIKDVVVFSRDKSEVGKCTGAKYKCDMAGCTGHRLVVKWPDGKITRPCTKGMMSTPSGYEIL